MKFSRVGGAPPCEISDLGDVHLTPNDTRFLFSNWGEEHTDEEIKRNVAAAQNHSHTTHMRHYNYALMARKKKLTQAFIEENAGGDSGELDIAANAQYDMMTSKQIEELRKKTQLGRLDSFNCVTTNHF